MLTSKRVALSGLGIVMTMTAAGCGSSTTTAVTTTAKPADAVTTTAAAAATTAAPAPTAKGGKMAILFDLKGRGDKSFNDSAAIGLDKGKYEKCVGNPAPVEAKITKNMESGMQLGVSGTPAFFINGRRLSGAMPYSEFKRIIDDELKSKKKT